MLLVRPLVFQVLLPWACSGLKGGSFTMCVLLWVQTETVWGALHQPPWLLTAVGDLTFHTGETEKPLATSASLRDKTFLFQS